MVCIILGEYCMPINGVSLSKQSQILTNNEIVRLVSLFAEQGVDKIRLTGGEPTIKKDIIQIVGKVLMLIINCILFILVYDFTA